MPSATIECHNVKQSVNGQWIDYKPGDTPIKGQYGFSLRIGYKNGEEWENYYVNDVQIWEQFAKGNTVVVEYEVRKSKSGRESNVITGVGSLGTSNSYADVASGKKDAAFAANNGSRNDSIEKQTHVKAWASMYAGAGTLPTPEEFAANVISSWERTHNPPEPKVDSLVEHVTAAQEQLDATPEPEAEQPADDIPF
jgi:hypothetical protein